MYWYRKMKTSSGQKLRRILKAPEIISKFQSNWFYCISELMYISTGLNYTSSHIHLDGALVWNKEIAWASWLCKMGIFSSVLYLRQEADRVSKTSILLEITIWNVNILVYTIYVSFPVKYKNNCTTPFSPKVYDHTISLFFQFLIKP
jgi:hypothetical protein